MNKRKTGPQQLLNPKPVVLAGTIVDGKPNFITVSWSGITSANPPTMSIAIRNIRYSLKGFKQYTGFSINIPSADMVEGTDYCGNASCSEFDKIKECGFNIFYGNSKSAPLIEQCPINIESEVFKIVDIGDHSLIIGKIIEPYVSENRFTNDNPDIKKIDPMCFCTMTSKSMGYYKVGEFIADTGSIIEEAKK